MPRSTSQSFCCQCPCPHGEPQPTPDSAGDPPTLAVPGTKLPNPWNPLSDKCLMLTPVNLPTRKMAAGSQSIKAAHHRTSSRVVDRVLVLRPGVRPVPLRWESRVQDVGPPEISRPHILSISESSPRDLHPKAKTQLHSTTSNLQRWTPHAK